MKRYGNLYAALTEAFEERGETHDDGTPIKQVGEQMTATEYRAALVKRLREKTAQFQLQSQPESADANFRSE